MAGSVGQCDAQFLTEGNKFVVLVVSQVGGRDNHQVINVGDQGVLPALAVGWVPAGGARVGDTRSGGDVTPEQPAD